MDDLSEQRRVGEGDALMYVLEDLKMAAPSALGSCDALARWQENAVDLLACLPDMGQRMSWAVSLAKAVAPGYYEEIVAGNLLRRAKEVRRCRVS